MKGVRRPAGRLLMAVLLVVSLELPARADVPFGTTSAAVNEKGVKGRRVLTLRPASIADLADLRVGDILLAINGYPVEKEDDEDGIIAMMPGGAQLQIVILRDHKRNILMGRMPPAVAVSKPAADPPPPAPVPVPRIEPDLDLPKTAQAEPAKPSPAPAPATTPPAPPPAGPNEPILVELPPEMQEKPATAPAPAAAPLPSAITQVAPPSPPPAQAAAPAPTAPPAKDALPDGVMSIDDVSVGN